MAKTGSSRKNLSKGTTESTDRSQLISPEERQRMIGEAAYFRALERGFTGGDPLDDWLVAEREIGRALPSPRQQKEELAAYENLRQAVRKVLAEARGNPHGLRRQRDLRLRRRHRRRRHRRAHPASRADEEHRQRAVSRDGRASQGSGDRLLRRGAEVHADG